jgi:YD repeat-containing protein
VITAADAGSTQADYTANHITSTAGQQYAYDGNGNIISDGIRTFAYNQDNRLVRVSIGGGVVGEYAYDAFGRRVKKVASGVTVLYHYVGGNLIAETDEYGNTQRNYI